MSMLIYFMLRYFDFHDGSSYLFQDYDFTTTKEIYFTDNGNVFGAFNGQQTYSIASFTISIQQIDPNDRWTLGTGWSISNGKARRGGHSVNTDIQQDVPVVNGGLYKFSYTFKFFNKLNN